MRWHKISVSSSLSTSHVTCLHGDGPLDWKSSEPRELLQAFCHKGKGLMMVFTFWSFCFRHQAKRFGPFPIRRIAAISLALAQKQRFCYQSEKVRSSGSSGCSPKRNAACCTDWCNAGIRHKQAFSIEAASQKASKYTTSLGRWNTT